MKKLIFLSTMFINQLFCMEIEIKNLVLNNNLYGLQSYLEQASKENKLKFNTRKKKSFRKTLQILATENINTKEYKLTTTRSQIWHAIFGLVNLTTIGFFAKTRSTFADCAKVDSMCVPTPVYLASVVSGSFCLVKAITDFSNKQEYRDSVEIKKVLKEYGLIDF